MTEENNVENNNVETNDNQENTALTEEDVKDYISSHKEVQDYLNSHYVPTKVLKEKLDKEKAKTQQVQTEYDSYKASKMTEEEKAEEEARKKEEDYAELKNSFNKMTAEKVFSENGLKEEQYEKLLPTAIKNTPEETKANAQAICDVINAQKQDIISNLKEQIKKETPKPEGGNVEQKSQSELDTETLEGALTKAKSENNFIEIAKLTRLIAERNKK